MKGREVALLAQHRRARHQQVAMVGAVRPVTVGAILGNRRMLPEEGAALLGVAALARLVHRAPLAEHLVQRRKRQLLPEEQAAPVFAAHGRLAAVAVVRDEAGHGLLFETAGLAVGVAVELPDHLLGLVELLSGLGTWFSIEMFDVLDANVELPEAFVAGDRPRIVKCQIGEYTRFDNLAHDSVGSFE